MGLMPTVFIVNGDPVYNNMFTRAGWTVVNHIRFADMVQFTGGSDVSPRMYGKKAHKYTFCSPERDEFESVVFETCIRKELWMAGICRGGQFLNVMCGGKMWQHVDKHAIAGGHYAQDHLTNSTVFVSSTHHQMMIPGQKAEVLMTAREGGFKERVLPSGGVAVSHDDQPDIEALYYKDQGALCYQPHPEFTRAELTGCRAAYFNYIEHCFGLRGDK